MATWNKGCCWINDNGDVELVLHPAIWDNALHMAIKVTGGASSVDTCYVPMAEFRALVHCAETMGRELATTHEHEKGE